jgi:serine/threonine protein phosphatase PrpC
MIATAHAVGIFEEVEPIMDVAIDLCGASDRGHDREENQDHYLIAELERSLRIRNTNLSGLNSLDQAKPFGQVLVVADGIGSRNTAGRASQLVIEGILRHFGRTLGTNVESKTTSPVQVEDHLAAALREGHRLIVRETRAKRSHRGIGTGVTLALICWPQFHLAHVGHTRCYLYRQGQIEPMTTDHTLPALPMRVDRLDETPAAQGLTPSNHVLYNTLSGASDDYEPELSQFSLQRNDVLVLCTDGVSQHLTPDQIGEVLQSDDSAHVSVTRLLRLARTRRNHDDATIIVAKFQAIDASNDTKVIDLSQP